MTTTNDHLERELEKLYARVPPPPRGLAAGRERMLAEAISLKAELASRGLSVGDAAETQYPQRRRKMKLFLAYKFIAAVTALVVGTTAAGGGVALAANDSLPGDMLYPVKIFVEDSRLSLTADPAVQAALNLRFAAERAEEMQQLMVRGEPVPEDVIARMVRHTEQVMAQIAQAEHEDVPGLLEGVMQRTRIQQQVLEQVRAQAPEETQPALRRALEVTKRAYETADAAQGDAQRFQKEYQHRYEGTPGPHGEASPAATFTPPCQDCTPVQEQNREGEQNQNQNQVVTPVGTPQQERERERNQPMTPTPEPSPAQNREQNQNQNQAVTPVGTQQQERDRERNWDTTSTPEPTPTPEPTDVPPEPTPPPGPGPHPTQAPKPTQTPKGEGNGGKP